MNKYTQYAIEVVEGDIVANKYIKQAAQRFLDDLERPDLEFKPKKVEKLIEFASVLHHYTGEHSGRPFILCPWQIFIVANIFGFYYKESGKRRYTQSYIEVSRKNGKTFLAALLCLFAMIADGEDAAEVVLAANSKEQARIAFEMTQTLAKQLDPSQKIVRSYRNEIKFFPNNSKLKVLAADDSKLDGFNAHFALLDEYHAAPTSKVRDVIKSSMGMRKNPHLSTITTAGFNKDYPCYQFRNYCIEVLAGVKQDDQLFSAIYELDEGDDWTDEKNWIKCTPNLNVTVGVDYLKSQVQQAINNPSDEVGVRTKNLDQWMDSEITWIPSSVILDCSKHIELDDFNGDDWLTYCGVDLASVSDLTSLAFIFTDGNVYYIKVFYFIPESALNDKFNSQKYKDWARQGHLIVTAGNVTDYDYITNFLMKYHEPLCIRKISYDRYNATQWAIQCTENHLPIEEYAQNLGSFNGPTRELERLFLSRKVFIDDNPINRYCFSNVRLKSDWNGNVKPIKEDTGTNSKKIDGVIAIIQALGVYLQEPHYSGSITTM